MGTVEIRLELPDDLFDEGLSEAAFVSRVRELAVLELLKAKRLHEHEAQDLLKLERWELVERMEAAGIAPTERIFERLRGELETAVSARAARQSPARRGDTMRLLHTMLRVGELDQSLRFYCDGLGMKLLHKKDYPEGRFTLAFVGYGAEGDTAVMELTHNWDTKSYDVGNGFGHVAIAVDDIHKTCAELKAKGAKVVREPGPMKYGGSVIAFVEDPNGYKIELIERK